MEIIFGMKYSSKDRWTETRCQKRVKAVEQLSLNTPGARSRLHDGAKGSKSNMRAKRFGTGTGKTVRGGTGKMVRGPYRQNGTGSVRAKRYGTGTGKTVRGPYGQNGTGPVRAKQYGTVRGKTVRDLQGKTVRDR